MHFLFMLVSFDFEKYLYHFQNKSLENVMV